MRRFARAPAARAAGLPASGLARLSLRRRRRCPPAWAAGIGRGCHDCGFALETRGDLRVTPNGNEPSTTGGVALHAAGVCRRLAPYPVLRRRAQPAFRPIGTDLDNVTTALELADGCLGQATL